MRTKQERGVDTGDIRLDAISPTEWRVCDRTVDSGDYLSILGFIERRNGHYEAMRMSAPAERLVFGTLAEAREAFALFITRHIPTGNSVV